MQNSDKCAIIQVMKENTVNIVKDDITKLDCDCIVNAANNSLLGGGGVDGAIHRAAGKELLAECKTLGGCATGDAKITRGYALKARHVIHTVGPIYRGTATDAQMLVGCYMNSLELAAAHDIHTIAFPAISAGVYGYPINAAAEIAVTSVFTWLALHASYGMTVTLCCYDDTAYNAYIKAYTAETSRRRGGELASAVMEMRLTEKLFALMMNGEKTVEIRLNDEKRRRLKVGDNIIFVRSDDNAARILAQVTALKRFAGFAELFSSELFSQTGCAGMTVEQAVESMYGYYTREQEQKYGALAVTVKRLQ